MRVQYIQLNEVDLDEILGPYNLRGGGLSDINVYQPRGGSFFGVVGSILRRAIPIIKSLIVPELGTFAQNLTNDIGQNVNFRQSLRKNLVTSGKNIGRRLVGGRRVRKKNIKKTNRKSKRKPAKRRRRKAVLKKKSRPVNDIFTSNQYSF